MMCLGRWRAGAGPRPAGLPTTGPADHALRPRPIPIHPPGWMGRRRGRCPRAPIPASAAAGGAPRPRRQPGTAILQRLPRLAHAAGRGGGPEGWKAAAARRIGRRHRCAGGASRQNQNQNQNQNQKKGLHDDRHPCACGGWTSSRALVAGRLSPGAQATGCPRRRDRPPRLTCGAAGSPARDDPHPCAAPASRVPGWTGCSRAGWAG